MKLNAVSLNQTKFYNIKEEDRKFIREIRSTYYYDAESATYCCEITPSYELRYLHTYIVWDDEPSDDKRDELDSTYCYGSDNEDIYMHCSDVRKITQRKKCGDFESMDEGYEYLQGNWPF